jgi:hypothetical protein
MRSLERICDGAALVGTVTVGSDPDFPAAERSAAGIGANVETLAAIVEVVTGPVVVVDPCANVVVVASVVVVVGIVVVVVVLEPPENNAAPVPRTIAPTIVIITQRRSV